MTKHRTSTRRSISSCGEFGLIQLIQKWTFGRSKNLVKGIGDDAAVFRLKPNRNHVLTMDTMVEGVDFKCGVASPQQIGWKALAINLSDIAAMGATPRFAVVSLTLPRSTSIRFVKGFYEGLLKLASRFHVLVVGGDLSRGPQMVSTIALAGECVPKYTLYRTGAKEGDLVCVTGNLGGSLLGRHLTFMPRIREGQFLARSRRVSAMIDISDGLLQDLEHLMGGKHLDVQIDCTQVPVSQAAWRRARGNQKKALKHALTDGEDFELLFTVPESDYPKLLRSWNRRFQVPLTVIGRVVHRTGKSRLHPLQGFQHF